MPRFECLFCQKNFPVNLLKPFCRQCGEPLLVKLPPGKKEILSSTPLSLDRFIDFLPLNTINPDLTLGEGNTPLIQLPRLRKEYRLPALFAKNEMCNPTGSFKDRGTAVAVQMAAASGISKIGTVSTGNMGSSTAAYGAKAGMTTFVLVKEGTPPEKLYAIGIHEPFMIEVKGEYGELFRKSYSLGEKHHIHFMNSIDPFRIEGYKVISLEIFTQLNHKVPEYILVPVSSGGNLIGLMKGFNELLQAGFIPMLPTFVGVQAQGCSPIAQAFSEGKSKVEKAEHSHTIAQSISNPDPPGGNLVLKMIREQKGIMLAVTDEEIQAAQNLLARYEGLFCLPASATTLAGLLHMQKTHPFDPNDRIVLILTGTGLKNVKAWDTSQMNLYHEPLEKLDSRLSAVIKNTQI